jgi:hypothetical protein
LKKLPIYLQKFVTDGFTKQHAFACGADMGDSSSAEDATLPRFLSRHDS